MNNGLVGLSGFPDAIIPVLRGHIAGLTLANATASSQVLTISAGVAIDSTNTVAMSTSGTYTKTVGQSFQPGARVSGSPSGLLAPGLSLTSTTWYHAFSISLATGPDFYADTSATAANAPPGTQAFRRIGSIRTDAALNATQFVHDGDYFRWLASVLDVNTTNPGTSAISSTLTVPTGINVQAMFDSNLTQGDATANSVYFSDLAANDEAASISAAPLSQLTSPGNATNLQGWSGTIRTNTSGQIRYRAAASNGNTIVRIATLGWWDYRGRNA